MRRMLACLCWVCILSGLSFSQTLPQQSVKSFEYCNPIDFSYSVYSVEHKEIRDPCIIKDGGRYYLVFTVWPFANRETDRLHMPDQGGSPGIILFSSPDLKEWKFENWLVKASLLPESSPYKNRFWAPEIHKMAGKYYLIFTADNWIKKEFNPAGTWGTAGYAFVGVADKITGPYEHITYIEGGACDTSLFEDTDGQTYAVIPAGDIFIQRIDLTKLNENKVSLTGQRVLAVANDNTDIGLAAKADYQEGPWLICEDGRYVLMYSGPYREANPLERQGYWAGFAYADSVLGPWKKDSRGQVFLGGHMAIFDGPDNKPWFSYRWEKDNSHRGLLCIDPMRLTNGRVGADRPTDSIVNIALP